MFSMVHHYGYSIAELNDLIPFELDLYINMVKDHLSQEKEKADQMRRELEAKSRARF